MCWGGQDDWRAAVACHVGPGPAPCSGDEGRLVCPNGQWCLYEKHSIEMNVLGQGLK